MPKLNRSVYVGCGNTGDSLDLLGSTADSSHPNVDIYCMKTIPRTLKRESIF